MSPKFHTCSQTTVSMRSKPDVDVPVFDPVLLAPGLPATTECRPA
jgi:hypothetical protein